MIPEGGGERGRKCVLTVPVDSLNGQTFQQMVLRQPVKKGGMGIRSYLKLRLAAFVGAVEQSVSALGLPTTGL